MGIIFTNLLETSFFLFKSIYLFAFNPLWRHVKNYVQGALSSGSLILLHPEAKLSNVYVDDEDLLWVQKTELKIIGNYFHGHKVEELREAPFV